MRLESHPCTLLTSRNVDRFPAELASAWLARSGRPMRNAAGGPQARPLESPLPARRRGSRGLAWRQQAGRRLGPSGRPPRRDVGEEDGGAGAHVFLPRAFARADGGGGAPSGGGASVRLVQYVQHTSLRIVHARRGRGGTAAAHSRRSAKLALHVGAEDFQRLCVAPADGLRRCHWRAVRLCRLL